MHEGLFLPEQTAVTDATAKNFAQDVAAAFVRGQYAVIDQKRSSAGVVGNDAEAGGVVVGGSRLLFDCFFADVLPGEFLGALDQRSEQVCLKVCDFPLQHGGYTLEAHAGVNGGFGEGRQLVAAGLA